MPRSSTPKHRNPDTQITENLIPKNKLQLLSVELFVVGFKELVCKLCAKLRLLWLVELIVWREMQAW